MKVYGKPEVAILTIMGEDIVRTSIDFSESGSGDSVSIKELFNLD